MEGALIIGLFSLIRIVTLTSERVALHGLGKSNHGALATMGIGFGGAAIVLWVLCGWVGEAAWMGSILWVGLLYAIAFGFYTASLARGPLSVVGPWSNATVVLLWMYHPILSLWSYIGIGLFTVGALTLTRRSLSTSVIWMLISDVLLASARFVDVSNLSQSPMTYSANLFTFISLWMLVPILLFRKTKPMVKLAVQEPGWSFIAATSNAAAYVTLFILLRWLHPAAVEAVSALSGAMSTFCGIFIFHEPQGTRKIVATTLMTAGSIVLLCTPWF